MTRLSMVHSFFLDRVAELLPEYKRLSNAYKPEENPSLLLKQGYGVMIGRASTSKKTHSPALSVTRTFSLVLTREYHAREDDSDAKALTEKFLLEDAGVISADIEKNWNMENSILRCRFLSDSGVEYVRTETDRFLKTVIDFEAEYFEVGNDC